MAESRSRRWWLAGGVVVVLAVVGTGVGLWVSDASGDAGYRTTAATTTDVRQTLDVTGSAGPVHQSTAAFQVAGTVAAVDVTVGQTVTAGQVLASLGTTSLQRAVTAAQATLNAANAKLTEDENAQTTATSTTTTTTAPTAAATTTSNAPSTTTTTGGPASTTTTTSPTGSGSSALQQAQQAVVSAQQTADADTQAASAALAAAKSACSNSGTGRAGGSGPGGSGPGTGTTTTTSPTTTTTAPTSAACTAALGQALAAQQQVAADQAAVSAAENALAQLLGQSSSSGPTTGRGGSSGTGTTPTTTTTPSAAPNTGATAPTSRSTTGGSTTPTSTASGTTSTGSGRSDTSGGTSGAKGGATTPSAGSSPAASDSPEQLATDQASIDSAKASLIKAEQSLTAAQLVSPIAGTVAAVSLLTGQTVSAGSTTDLVTVINAGSYQVTGSLTSTDAAEVKVGDEAIVSVNGTTGTLDGTVARVGPPTTSDTATTYPLIVALPAGSHGIAAGSAAQVAIVLDDAHDTLAVPTSAVHTVGTNEAYVLLLRGGQPVRQTVKVGIVGDVYTQITSGVTKGDEIVLADLTTAVPSSSSTTMSRFGAGLGGLTGGGGLGGGGFTGGDGFTGGGGFSGR